MRTLEDIRSRYQDRFKTNVSMSAMTSFRTGGAADYVIWPQNADELIELTKSLRNLNIPYLIIGKGSNLLVRDGGIGGAVICTCELKGIESKGAVMSVLCGTLMSEAAHYAYKHHFTGMEFMSGIPGTVGGGVYMNAGAYGGEIKDIITGVEVIRQNGDIVTINCADLELGYRKSVFSKTSDMILRANFELLKDDPARIHERMKEFNLRRAEKQPLSFPSAGSTFKRPDGYYAAKLIDDAGLKGKRIGGAMVSEKHAGFVINFDNATSSDIIALIEWIQQTVFEKFGVMLEPEVKITGRPQKAAL